MADAAFTSRSDSGMGAFFRHVEDTHLDPHPQYLTDTAAAATYRPTATAITQADMASTLRVPYIVTSGTRPGSPTEGDHIYETDTNLRYVYTGAAWTLAGEQLAARTVSTSVSTATATLPTIDNGYRLRVAYRCRHASSTSINVLLTFNGDTGSNYWRQFHYANDGATLADADAAAQTSIAIASCGNESSSRVTAGEFVLPGYLASAHKTLVGSSFDPRNLTAPLLLNVHGVWASTSAVTSVTLTTSSGSFAVIEIYAYVAPGL